MNQQQESATGDLLNKGLTKAIELNLQKDEVYYQTGIALYRMGRNEDALKDLTNAIELNPQKDIAYFMRGVILGDLGRKEEAIKDYTKAIEINPQFYQVYFCRAIILNEFGKKEEAIKDYTKAIEINPQFDQGYSYRGTVLNELGRKEEAIQDFSKAIEINPQYDEAYNDRGIALFILGRKQEAIKDFTKAIEINPQLTQAYSNRGHALIGLGRKEEAYNDFLKAYQIQPQDPISIIQLGRLLLSNGEKQKSYEFLVQGLKLAQTLTEEDKKKFHLSEKNILFIQEQVKLVQQIEQEISKVNVLLKSKTISEREQNLLQAIEAQFKQQINQPINKNDNNTDNNILQQILKELKDLKQKHMVLEQKNIILTDKVIQIENQRPQIIIKEMDELKQDKNRYMYYQSLYWRLYNYISACQQLSTDLFQKNTDAVIDNNKERVAQIISQVVQQISNQAGSIPIVGTVITIISSALEFGFQYHLDYKFNQIVRKLTQIVQERCASRIDIDEEIQLAIIKQSKQLQELTQDQQLKDQGLLKHIEQIQEAERDGGNLQVQNPYWKQGVVDTLRILRNLLVNYKQIQLDNKKELHVVILESFKEEERQMDHHQVVRVNGNWCGRCCNSCSIQ